MGAAPGIAGSRTPEQEGCFLAFDSFLVDFFTDFDSAILPLDVWEVTDVDPASMLTAPENFEYFPGIIDAGRLRLVRRDVWPDTSR